MTAFDRERLDAMVAEGWLRSQRHPEADLWIYNYTEKAQYENYWTPETLACRGLILDAAGEVVARPFAKFFNWGTPQAAGLPLHEPFVVTEKFDGSLGILYYLDDGARIATRGSFTSEQAIQGTAMLAAQDLEHRDDSTPLFEIVYPGNRIVVDYGERRELVLLAAIDHATGADRPLPMWSGRVAPTIDGIEDPERLHDLAAPNAEGFVIAWPHTGQRVKVKFAEYLRLHKIVTGVNARMVWESMCDGDALDELLTGIPDEIHDWIEATRGDLSQAFGAIYLAAKEAFDARPPDADRKALAAYFLASGANPAVLFRMLDGKPVDDLIWKAIKPGPLTPAGVFAEVAP
jgi:RNA ligase